MKGRIYKRLRVFWKYRALTLMALPALLYFMINNYLPLPGLSIAFKKLDFRLGIWDSPWVGFQNFKYLFMTQDAWVIVRNTLGYNLVFILTVTLGSVFTAILMNEIGSKLLTKLYQTSLLLPALVSMSVVGYVVYAFLSPTYGYMNKLLEFLGMEHVNWYVDPAPWPIILILVWFWKKTGYSSVVYLATIVGIDHSYYEAAIVDGANRWERIRYITLPMLKSTIITLVLLDIGKIFHADFGLFYQVPLASGAISDTTSGIDTYVYRALMESGNMEMSSAAGFFQSIVGFVLVMITNYVVKKISEEDALF